MPCLRSSSVSSVLSSCEYAAAGNVAISMAAFFSGSAKPAKASLMTMPVGGTRPMREPGGNAGSAARDGIATTNDSNRTAKPAPAVIERKRLLRIVWSLCSGHLSAGPLGRGSCNPAHSEIDPSPLPEQGRCSGIDPIDAVECKPRAAAENDDVAGIEPEGAGRVAALSSADAEQARIAKRDRDDGSMEFLLIAILVQAHFRGRRVEVDETALRRVRVSRNRIPYGGDRCRYRRPGPAGLRMHRLIAVAALVRGPAERPAIRHEHCARNGRFRHPRRGERRRHQALFNRRQHRPLAVAVEIAGIDAQSGDVCRRVHFRAFIPYQEAPQERAVGGEGLYLRGSAINPWFMVGARPEKPDRWRAIV